jgi:hypothetical protein
MHRLHRSPSGALAAALASRRRTLGSPLGSPQVQYRSTEVDS